MKVGVGGQSHVLGALDFKVLLVRTHMWGGWENEDGQM
jgi:hypothetical protein